MFGVKIKSYVLIQSLIASVLTIGELTSGYIVGWSAPIIPKLMDPKTTPLPYVISETHQSWVASMIYFGCIGTFIGGYFSNRIGRPKTILLGGTISLTANILVAAAQNLPMLLAGRILVGVGVCVHTVVQLSYIGEISSPNIRGIILTSLGVFHALGQTLVYAVGPFLGYVGVGCVVIPINIIFVTGCCFLPESPMFYAIKNDEESAKSSLKYLGRDNDIDSELKIMMAKVKEQQQNKNVWRELLTVRSNQKSLFITVCLSFFQQASGILYVLFFATTIFKDAGSSIRPDYATIIIGATMTIGACVSPLVIDKHGRKILLLLSTAGCSIAMTILGTYFYLKTIEYQYIDGIRWLPLTSMIFGIFVYSIGLSIIPNTLIGELFTPKARALGPSISITSGLISGLLSVTTFGYILVIYGANVTFWIFAVTNAIACLFVMVFVVETKGKSLMEIQDLLEKRKDGEDVNCIEKDLKSGMN